ncbi:nitrile hydratase subunit beta [Alicyclobacillus fastidiosus]|uniref:nitrile hydratase subunit beta n=1 Tax=Alicyclobacillus fastidiosus TaxID=392011 RepID=UPI0024E18E99|nr:nitrile hydratase subunit beta [Alicyclobacillus fastidiosus]
MNGIHDVGGMDGFGPIQREDNEPVFHAPWEGRMRAIHTLVRRKCHIYNTDESRYYVERIDPVYYLSSTYYQNWLLRMETLLMERGVFSEGELQEKMDQLCPSFGYQPDLHRRVMPPTPSTQRKFVIETKTDAEPQSEPKFLPGTLVKTKKVSPLGHTRLPRYVRGKQGVIEKMNGHFILPDIRVHQGIDVYQPVYLVCFEAKELWGKMPTQKTNYISSYGKIIWI